MGTNMHYIATHWRGEQGLLRSTLVNGVLGYLLVILGFIGLASAFKIGAGIGVVAGLCITVMALWGVWATVGIFRCGLRNILHSGKRLIPKIGGILANIGLCVVWYFVAQDLAHLGVFRWLFGMFG